MKKQHSLLIFILFIQLFYTAVAQQAAPGILWQRTLGGSGDEVLTAMAVGADKSVALCGYSNSNASGNKSQNSFGGYDYFVIKLDAAGKVVWNKTYGGSDHDYASAIITTSDGGYLLGGSSVSDKSGSKSLNAFQYSYDYWVLKLDANGNKIWNKTFGGLYTERLSGLAELPNGTYVIAGSSYSNKGGTKTTDNKGSYTKADYWTVVLNKDGTELSQQLLGGTGHDVATCIVPFGKSSFYIGGYSYSGDGGGKSVSSIGNNDYYIVRSSAKGNVEMDGGYGGKLSDYLTCMQVLPDSSVILGGYSNSSRSTYKSENFYGVVDMWLIKLKKDGTKQWDKTIAGAAGDGFGGDYLVSVKQTKDKGFIIGGYSNAHIGHNKTANTKGGYDYWIVKTDANGTVQWDKTIGGNANDILTGVYELDSNEYILAGTSASTVSGDKTEGVIGGSGKTDFWVVKLGAAPSASSKVAPIAVTENHTYKLDVIPNPVKDVLTIHYCAAVSRGVNFVVYNANGKAVLQTALPASSATNTKSFNVAALPGGAYFATMYINGVKLTKAFTKE